MAQKFRTWPLDCINLPDSYYFRSAVSMCVSKEKNIFAAFGGYEEGGNKLFLLQNIDQIEEDHWEEQWRIGNCFLCCLFIKFYF